ncbi:MAG: hypothetical protein HYZ47_02670 [Simkania negevensis]|nr:hypothetical protein [Simkania negevensis]
MGFGTLCSIYPHLYYKKAITLWKAIDLFFESERVFYFDLSQVQDSFSFRHLYRARSLAFFLIDERGKLSIEKIEKVLEAMEKEQAPLYPNGFFDEEVKKHMQEGLAFFLKEKTAISLVERLRSPLKNKFLEGLIRDSLLLKEGEKVEEKEMRRALLSALLFPLRQTLGSCFATAPAILIQREQKEQFLIDLVDLFSIFSVKRTFAGKEHIAPISLSWGEGDLKKRAPLSHIPFLYSPAIIEVLGEVRVLDPSLSFQEKGETLYQEFSSLISKQKFVNVEQFLKKILNPSQFERGKRLFCAQVAHPLLKTWEFTLATFSDYKVEVSKWNLVNSLGLDPKEEDGIGAIIYQKIEESFNEEKKRMEKAYVEYKRGIDEENTQNALLRSASSYEQARTLKATLIATEHHIHATQDLYEKGRKRAERLSQFFSPLMNKYFEQFPHFFQEVYDVEMFEEEGIYDDSPAGFRLIYKQGSADPTFWKMIHSEEDYINALKNFFNLVETEIFLAFEEEKKLIEEITTTVIHHLMRKEFLSAALKRMKKVRGAFSQDLGEKKPWSYTSGGSLSNLLRCYYSIEGNLDEEQRVPHSPLDLCIFLIELMKGLPHPISKPFEDQGEKGLLATSPTHAYIFKPGLFPFKAGWTDSGFTYTWVRDQLLYPAKEFYQKIFLDEGKQAFLAKELIKEVGHLSKKPFAPNSKIVSLSVFREDLLDHFFPSKEKRGGKDLIDSFLQSAFPLIPRAEGLKTGEKILYSFYEEKQNKGKQAAFLFQEMFSPAPLFFSFSSFYHVLLEVIAKVEETPSSSLATRLDKALKKEGLLPPSPCLFADTNWSTFYFAFFVNPATLELEVWRYDPRIRRGFPLSAWKHWLNGSAKEAWTVFSSPRQYEARPRFGFEMLKKKV